MEGSFGDALSLFDEALELVADGAEAAELRLDLAFAHSILGHAQAAAEHARAAVEAATASGDAGLQAAALAMSATREFRLGQPLDRARLEAALALEDPDRQLILPLRPSRLAGIAEYYSDNFGRAAELYSRLRRRMIDRGEDSHLPMLDADLAMAERTRGNLRRALEIADEGCEIAQVVASHTVQADMLCERSYVRAALGDVDGARADADATRACTTDDWYADTWLTGLHGFLELSLGDAAAAGRALEPLAGVVEAAGECDQFTATIIPDEIEALIALGQLDRARLLLGILRAYAAAQKRHSTLGRVERCAALLAAADGELAEAEQLVAIAIEHHERVELPLELGRTLLAAAQIRRRAKRKGAARDTCRAASEIFETLGARLWLERAASEMRRTGMRHAEGDELTPTETRVAELAATGLTNRRIAEALFVSPKTVEANLARIYLKLGIRTRAELGRVMAQSDTTRTFRH
jgi:DNA-binding CsgD family transcriptional regulator